MAEYIARANFAVRGREVRKGETVELTEQEASVRSVERKKGRPRKKTADDE